MKAINQIPAFRKTGELKKIFELLTKDFFTPGKSYKIDNTHSFVAKEIIENKNNKSQEVEISFNNKNRVWSFVLFMEDDNAIVAGMTLHGSEVDNEGNFNCPVNIDELIANLEESKNAKK